MTPPLAYLAHSTTDWTQDDFFALMRHCAWLECAVLDMLAVMYAESGARATAANPASSARGLIQFMKGTDGTYFGWSEKEFLALGVYGQLPYVLRHFAPHKGQLKTPGTLYTAVFLPAFVREAADPEYVLCSREKLGWAFTANAVFDADGDGRIQVFELEQAIRRNATGPRWRELCERAGVKDPGWTPDPRDLTTIWGVQTRLKELGFYAGEVDGFRGPLTDAAIVAFRESVGLPPGTTVGPRTRAALTS